MTIGQLIDLLSDQSPTDAIVLRTGDGYATVDGLRAAGPCCMCLTSGAIPDARYDDDEVRRVNSPIRQEVDPFGHLDLGDGF